MTAQRVGRRWLGRSQQSWKLFVFMALILVAAVLMALLFRAIQAEESQQAGYGARLVLALASVTGAAMGWLVFSIRCAKCGHRPIWNIIRTQPASDWLVTVVTLERCPNCNGTE